MTILVTDQGFQPAPVVDAVGLDALASHQGVVEIAHTDDPALLADHLASLRLIRVTVPAFNDGRGFTVGRRLRVLGYTGALHAVGPMIADQFPMARRVGFDAVEIPDDIAQRQPEAQWLNRANWRAHDYQARLKA
jgi:uncharacterized protein (DUF934 family)